jgi:hypothetical protein
MARCLPVEKFLRKRFKIDIIYVVAGAAAIGQLYHFL